MVLMWVVLRRKMITDRSKVSIPDASQFLKKSKNDSKIGTKNPKISVPNINSLALTRLWKDVEARKKDKVVLKIFKIVS